MDERTRFWLKRSRSWHHNLVFQLLVSQKSSFAIKKRSRTYFWAGTKQLHDTVGGANMDNTTSTFNKLKSQQMTTALQRNNLTVTLPTSSSVPMAVRILTLHLILFAAQLQQIWDSSHLLQGVLPESYQFWSHSKVIVGSNNNCWMHPTQDISWQTWFCWGFFCQVIGMQ